MKIQAREHIVRKLTLYHPEKMDIERGLSRGHRQEVHFTAKPIELIGFSNPPPEPARRARRANEIGHSHLSFYVTDLDATLRELRAQGVPVEEETRAVLMNGIECCVVRDPDGFPIEIVQMPMLTLLPYETEG